MFDAPPFRFSGSRLLARVFIFNFEFPISVFFLCSSQPNLFHYGLHPFFRAHAFLIDHAQAPRRNRRIALPGACHLHAVASVRSLNELGKGSGWSHQTMRRSDLVQHKERERGATTRTTQIVFGERQHLLRVLDSLEGTDLPIARMQQERRILEELIHARTRDLNQINTAWDEKIGLVLSSDAKPEMLEKLAKP